MKPFRLTPPRAYIPKEYDDQVAIFEYAAMAAKQDERWNLLFATLNGVRLPVGLAVKMKKAGNKQGVPDMILDVTKRAPDGNIICAGLRVELKRERGGVISDNQKWWHDQLRRQGYKVDVAKGARHAIEIIKRYLEDA